MRFAPQFGANLIYYIIKGVKKNNTLRFKKKQITENQDLEITARTVTEHRNIDSLDCGLMKALIRSIIIYSNNTVHVNWNFSL